MGSIAMLINRHKLQSAGGNSGLTAVFVAAVAHALANGVIHHKQNFWLSALVVRIYKHGTLLEFAAVRLKNQVRCSVHQRMTWVD